jgi:hypothetical protein
MMPAILPTPSLNSGMNMMNIVPNIIIIIIIWELTFPGGWGAGFPAIPVLLAG